MEKGPWPAVGRIGTTGDLSHSRLGLEQEAGFRMQDLGFRVQDSDYGASASFSDPGHYREVVMLSFEM